MQPCATPVLLLITQKIAHSLLIEVNEVETGKSNWRKEFNLKSTNLLGLYALLRKGSKAWLKFVEDWGNGGKGVPDMVLKTLCTPSPPLLQQMCSVLDTLKFKKTISPAFKSAIHECL